MGATATLISTEAGFVNFAFRHIFVLPTISGFALENRSTDELHCPADLSEATLILKKSPSNQLSSFKVPYLHFCLHAVVKTALSKR